MSETDQFWLYAKEAILSISSAKTDEDKQGLLAALLSARRSEQVARFRPPHVWMAPLMQELFCVKGRGRLRSCVRPFYAVTYEPLALMDSAGRGLISWSGFKSP
jgi:hypothetical protein